MSVRIGHGYDVHKLVKGRELILAGVSIPHEFGLLGHSDADVAAHAVMDALLGAAALGDCGAHFPDNDEKWRGANSLKLLGLVADMLGQRGYVTGNVDVTIVAQNPKLAPYIASMRANLAKALKTDVGNVSVKATTEERLGFTGREEGLAAHAVCVILKQ